jgi:hypothetical protein
MNVFFNLKSYRDYTKLVMDTNKEKGAILLICVILLPVIIMMLALAIDLGMFFLHRAAFQQSGDSITLSISPNLLNFKAGVTQNVDRTLIEEDFKKIKPLALAMFEAQTREVRSGDEVNQGIRILSDTGRAEIDAGRTRFTFTDRNNPNIFIQENAMRCRQSGSWGGGITNRDYVHYTSNCARIDNIILQVTRGVRCYDQRTGVRYFCSLEDLGQGDVPATSWEWANAVLLRGRVNGVSSFFARAFMDFESTDIVISSISYLPGNLQVCGQPLCQDIFRDDLLFPGFEIDTANHTIPGVPEGNLKRCQPILGL